MPTGFLGGCRAPCSMLPIATLFTAKLERKRSPQICFALQNPPLVWKRVFNQGELSIPAAYARVLLNKHEADGCLAFFLMTGSLKEQLRKLLGGKLAKMGWCFFALKRLIN